MRTLVIHPQQRSQQLIWEIREFGGALVAEFDSAERALDYARALRAESRAQGQAVDVAMCNATRSRPDATSLVGELS